MNKLTRVKKLPRSAVKEAFDNLPCGVCYFNENGLPRLCNRVMHRLSFALSGRDLQRLSELRAALENPVGGVIRETDVYRLPDGTSWRFLENEIKSDGRRYTEYTASDVTELFARLSELDADNKRLREAAKQLRRLSANVLAMTREEEILSLKMRVHDQMGRCLVAAHRVLRQNQPMESADSIVDMWRSAIRLTQKSGGEQPQTDLLSELREASAGMIDIILTGSLPTQEDAAYLIVTAIRECVTNALRHARATELYAELAARDGNLRAVVTNNGAPPAGEIAEGGGLSSLRQRVESAGGSMVIKSAPVFELAVSVPIGKELSL
jgi:PAS domain-containing protein